MSSSLRRGVATAAVLASSIAVLTACGAGEGAGTNGVRPDNASAHVDDIKVQSVNVILPEDGDGIAGLSARLFNEGTEEQVLESVTLPDGAVAELIPAEGETSVVLPAGGSVALGGEGNAAAVINDAAAAGIALGNAQHVVFALSDTGEISVHARVVPASGGFDYYADWAPTPAPEPEPEEEEPAAPDEEQAEEEPGADEGTAAEGTEGDAEQPGAEEQQGEQPVEESVEEGAGA